MTDTLTFYTDSFGEHRWRVSAGNGEPTLACTEGYVHREDAEVNARRYLFLEATDHPDVFEVIPVRRHAGDKSTGLISLTPATLELLLDRARTEAPGHMVAAEHLVTEATRLRDLAADMLGDGDQSGAYRAKQTATGLEHAAEFLRGGDQS